MADDDGFLGRWSRRKAQARSGVLPRDEAPPPRTAPVEVAVVPREQVDRPCPDPVPQAEEGVTAQPPTLDDVARLTPQSDFSRFVAREVAPDVRNAALKKLFADPHFNLMDGLDIYIDDYSQPDPIPPSMLRQMAQAKLLGLFNDDQAQVETTAAAPIVQAAPATDNSHIHEDTDLQLQPHDAARCTGADEGARRGEG